MLKTMLNSKKVFLAAIVLALGLVLIQATCAYAGGIVGKDFDDGNLDGVADYDISHLVLSQENCYACDPLGPATCDSVGNYPDMFKGDGNVYYFNDSYSFFGKHKEDYDIEHLGLVAQEDFDADSHCYEVALTYITDTWDLDLNGESFKVQGDIFMDSNKICHINYDWRDKSDWLHSLDYEVVWTTDIDYFKDTYGCTVSEAIKDGRFIAKLTSLHCDAE